MIKKGLMSVFAALVLLTFTACSPTEVTDMSYNLKYQDTDYAGTYTGGVQDKLPNGEGVFTFDDGENTFNYTGTWSAGNMSGKGKLTASKFLIKFTDVDRLGHFEGEVMEGVPEGKGTFSATTDEGIKYSYNGNFKNGKLNGFGEQRYEENEDFNDKIGTFTDNEFTPTSTELFAYLGENKDSKYGIRSMADAFLSAHKEIFVNHTSEGLDDLTDPEYRYEVYAKSPDKYGDKLLKLSGLHVVQAAEFEMFNYKEVTFILAQDENYNAYYIYYIGTTDVYEGDYISAYVLPLDYFTYKSVSGNEVWAIACAAANITK